ncbi:BQ2448_6912 [Microbotryum intermedium]|uniref:BQ2448_6912 protein n=1 Tax=Microbotryum intermedium TaxID=269621 RepID=A0A238FIC0_9BASI|nr:BQ2448_6912 [Microbotryum intermedium]
MSFLARIRSKVIPQLSPPTSETRRLRTSLIRREKLLTRVRVWVPLLQSGLIIVGFLYLFAIPAPQLGRRHYISENALQPGQVNTNWNWADVHIADAYAKKVEAWIELPLHQYVASHSCWGGEIMRADWNFFLFLSRRTNELREAFQKLGYATATQDYAFDIGSRNSTLQGTNVYSILQAPKTDGAESLVLGASWLSRAYHEGTKKRRVNIRGVASTLALANFFKKYSIWSKDIIFLISDDYIAGAQAWVDEYHGNQQSNIRAAPLSRTTGPIWAALNLDYPYHSFSHLGLFYEGVNGHLANLDFLNSASHITKAMGVAPVLHADVELADLMPSVFYDTPLSFLDNHVVRTYMRAAKTVIHQVALTASGKAQGPEAVFGKYRIDALALFGVPAEGPHGFYALGRIVESTFRSLNNLLERFHQSFFLYIMTSVDTFVAIGNYLAAPVLVCAGMTIMGLSVWEQAGRSLKGDRRERFIGKPIAIIGLTHAVGLGLFTYASGLDPTREISAHVGGCLFYQSRLAPTLVFILLFAPLILSIVFKTRRRKGRAPSSMVLASLSLILGGMTIGVVACLNFGASVLLSLTLCPPLTLVSARRNPILERMQQFLILVFSPPVAWALIRVWKRNEADEWAKGLLLDWQMMGTWSMPFTAKDKMEYLNYLPHFTLTTPTTMTLGQRIDFYISQIAPLPRSLQHSWCSRGQSCWTTTTIASLVVPLVGVWLYTKLIHVPWNESAQSFEWNVPDEASPSWTPTKVLSHASIASHLSDPSLLPSRDQGSKTHQGRKYITCYAPASGAHLSTLPATTSAEIDEAITRAEKAQKEWKTSAWSRRRKVMRSLLRWCTQDMQAIARIASRDTGKTLVDAAFGEILTTCEKLRWIIANGEQCLKPEARRSVLGFRQDKPLPNWLSSDLTMDSLPHRTNMILAHKVSKVLYEPLGVVAAIVSWNYPAHNALSPIIASLFSGNAIVVKPSELVAWSSHHYVQAVRSCLSACGEDPNLVQIVVPLPDTVEHLTGHRRIKHITFIGSEQIGQKVALKGAEAGTPVLLELGGKDPCIILDSADLRTFEDTWMRAAFQAAGQNCIGAERFIVHEKVYDRFVASMANRVEALKVGDVLAKELDRDSKERVDVGAMVSDRLFGELERLITLAVQEGARCIIGGKRIVEHPTSPKGHYFQPTLLVDVTTKMEIANQEVFAPVMTVMKFRDLDHAIELANSTRYGLGASVFGRNYKDCRYVVDRVEAGMVCTNDFGVFYLNQALPFGGCKASGYGRFAGIEGLRGLCNPKAVTEDRLHGWIQTGIPPLLAYPIHSGLGAWTFVQGLVNTMYADGPWNKFKGLVGLVSAK